ncbi:hypothetical protein EDWATA_03015 [Edwardsiella tarda ATCC 23685]|uniref:Uncharacterized protein n=1 Tax=Edwardsiella tarda ATCC 23685 TaxID=500638 RepID=D4F8C8_EDWTA|nr:hypothetical protein EDWATA_03015 [Edwardsiella tarda ATCC 23685]
MASVRHKDKCQRRHIYDFFQCHCMDLRHIIHYITISLYATGRGDESVE